MSLDAGVIAVADVVEAPPTTSLNGEPTDAEAQSSDIVDEWGMQSFPASDPPANW